MEDGLNEQTHKEIFTEMFQDFLDKDYSTVKTAGQPKFIKDPKAMAKLAIKYLTNAAERREPLRLTAFILKSKLNTRQGLDNYKKYSEDFNICVQRIKLIMEDYNVGELYSVNNAGARFVLSCGFGWIPTERQVVENHTINVEIGNKEEEEE